MRIVGEDLERGGQGLLVDALGVVGRRQAALLLLPAEAHGVHLEHGLDVDLEADLETKVVRQSNEPAG